MPLSEAKRCPKFRSSHFANDLGINEDICTCDWRPGLIHRTGEIATPEFCSSSHQGLSTPLAGWFSALPTSTRASEPQGVTVSGADCRAARASSTPRKPRTAPELGTKSARRGRACRKTSGKPLAKSARNHSNDDHLTAGTNETSFKHQGEASAYIKEYREKYALRLVGSDGSSVDKSGVLEFGKNLPDPYASKSENFRRICSRLHDLLLKRPRPSADTGSRGNNDHLSKENNGDTEKIRTEFKISDQVQTNFSDIFSPAFQRQRDMTFQPYVNGSSANVQRQARLRYTHGTERAGSLPSIYRGAEGVQFPMPAYVVTDSGNFYGDRLRTPPKAGVVSETDIGLLEPKSANGNKTSRRIKPSANTSADFDTAMFQFLQNAKQNLEKVREQRIRKETLERSRLVTTRGGNGLAVTSRGQRSVRSKGTATEARRVNLGVSQS